jgi:hypothetical protein
MQRTAAGEWKTTYGTGVGCGLVAGLVGVADWVKAQHDLDVRLVAFHTAQQQYPSFGDATNVVRGYEWFYFSTAPLAAAIAFFICLLAAFTVCWRLRNQRDAIVAAWVAAIIAGSIWGVATFVVTAITPAPDMTVSVFPCEGLLGFLFFSSLIPLIPVAAWMGMRVGQFFSRGHHAR